MSEALRKSKRNRRVRSAGPDYSASEPAWFRYSKIEVKDFPTNRRLRGRISPIVITPRRMRRQTQGPHDRTRSINLVTRLEPRQLINGIGSRLCSARSLWVSHCARLRRRSYRLAQQWDIGGYQISESWLDRVERGEGMLSATKLIVLAESTISDPNRYSDGALQQTPQSPVPMKP